MAGIVLFASLTAGVATGQEAGGSFRGLFKGRPAAESGAEQGTAQALESSQTTVSAPVAPSGARADRPGEGNRFAPATAREQGVVVVNRNATAAVGEKRASRKEVSSSSKSPYNPMFGMPVFVPDAPPAGPTLAQGGMHTARGKQLTHYTPVEVKEDRRDLQAQELAGPKEPTPDELKKAAERKQKQFDDIYTAKTTLPPLTFDSTVRKGPPGSTGPTREVGNRVLRQYVPTGPETKQSGR